MDAADSGNAGNLKEVIDAYILDSSLQSVALRDVMVLPSLVLQKPS